MTDTHDLSERNAHFAATRFDADLTINPRGNMMIIGCVDPRVDPAHVLGLDNGEAAIIRNVGGRVTPATLRTMAMLSKVGQANAETRHPGVWNLVILHHTDCGMTDLVVPGASCGVLRDPTQRARPQVGQRPGRVRPG